MINKFLLWGFVLLLGISAFLLGKTTSQQNNEDVGPTTAPVVNSIVPKPTSAPAVIYKTVSPTATPQPAQKKVSVFIDDYGGITKGNFYCYEDKVNELSNLQNDIRIYEASADSCNAFQRTNASNCSNSCPLGDVDAITACVNSCWDNAIPNCDDKNNKVGDLRKELNNKVHQYCP